MFQINNNDELYVEFNEMYETLKEKFNLIPKSLDYKEEEKKIEISDVIDNLNAHSYFIFLPKKSKIYIEFYE